VSYVGITWFSPWQALRLLDLGRQGASIVASAVNTQIPTGFGNHISIGNVWKATWDVARETAQAAHLSSPLGWLSLAAQPLVDGPPKFANVSDGAHEVSQYMPHAAAILGGVAGSVRSAAEGVGGGSTTFLHGTTTAAAEDIAANGLKAVSTNTHGFPLGSFFTHEASQPLSEVAASHWPVVSGKVAGTGVRVVGMQLPNSVLNLLRAAGLVRTGAVPGVVGFPAETVFLPEAFPILNQNAQFIIMLPTF